MNEKLIEAVLRQVEDRLGERPTALLLGREPTENHGYRLGKEKPYTAVVIGSMENPCTIGKRVWIGSSIPTAQAVLCGAGCLPPKDSSSSWV